MLVRLPQLTFNRYPYITHVINNAGVGSFIGIHVVKGLIELVRNPVRAVTAPNYKIEVKGEISADGLGWVWQCNVFGHYVMYRSLLPILRKSPFRTSRVVWMSSLEALRDVYDPNDFQLTKTEMPYEGSKCQMDLLAVTLDRNLVTSAPDSGPAVRHMVVQPGVVDTNIMGATQIGYLLQWLKIISFYFVSLFSPHQCSLVYNYRYGSFSRKIILSIHTSRRFRRSLHLLHHRFQLPTKPKPNKISSR
jgi:3-keto steroid reductase